MQIRRFGGLEEALRHLTSVDKDYVLVRHELPAGERVPEHLHPYADEWVIVDHTTLKFYLDFEEIRVAANETVAMHVPKSRLHALLTLEPSRYTVLRDMDDSTLFLDDILAKKNRAIPKADPCGILRELYMNPEISISYIDVIGDAKPHVHRIMQEFYRVEVGCGQIVIGENTFSIGKGDVIPIPKNTVHYLKKLGSEKFEVSVVTYPRYDPADFIPV